MSSTIRIKRGSGVPGSLAEGELAIDTAAKILYSANSTAVFEVSRNTVDIAHGGTGATTAGDARTNLGLVIGTDVQAYDAELAALAGLTSAADKLPYFTGSGAAAVTTLTTFGRTILDDADAAAVRATIGVDAAGTASSTNVTLAGSLDYLTLAGQVITRGAIALTTDVSGTLPVGNGGTGATTLTSNAVLTGNGTSAITPEANLSFDGSTLAVTGALTVSGDFTVNGTTTTLNTSTVEIDDSLLKLAASNSADTIDTGWYSVYTSSGTKYNGIIRDATDSVFKVWSGFTTEPGTTANFAEGALAQLDAIIDGGSY